MSISDGSYYSFGPSRILDTRSGSGGSISAGQTRTYSLLAGAQFTMACNLTVVSTSNSGYLAIYSADLGSRPQPYSSINWYASGQVIANFVVFDLGNAGFDVYCGGTGNTHFILDTIGYFLNNGAALTAAEKAEKPAHDAP
jgi:hypothetical protein